jgi:hypothetical protein
VTQVKVRYFVVDGNGRLRKAPQAAVQALWDGGLRADVLGCRSGTELRLASVVCDNDLVPRKIFLLRLPLCRGRFTPEGRLALCAFARPDCVTPAESAEHHAGGWPTDFYRQLAVALDVPVRGLDALSDVGGPLLVAAAVGVTPNLAARLLR